MLNKSTKYMMRFSFLHAFWVFLSGFLLSCSPWSSSQPHRPNIIIFSIEGLNFDKLSCGEPFENPGGFEELCANAVRFTHFYSPSTTSQSTMASLLTGLTPTEHRVLDNGAMGIAETIQTLPEKAVAAGYSTGFFSGGPPLLCKSGLQQGFELCDDEFLTSDNNIYRPVHTNLSRAKRGFRINKGRFCKHICSRHPVLQPDHHHPEGKERAKGIDSQVDEIDESLGAFPVAQTRKILEQHHRICHGSERRKPCAALLHVARKRV